MTDQAPSGEKTSKLVVPTFNGTDAEFPLWWPRFEAYASVYGFDAALEDGGEDDLPAKASALSSDNDTKKKQ